MHTATITHAVARAAVVAAIGVGVAGVFPAGTAHAAQPNHPVTLAAMRLADCAGASDGSGNTSDPSISPGMGSFLNGLNQKVATAGRLACEPTDSPQFQIDQHQAQIWGQNGNLDAGAAAQQNVDNQVSQYQANVDGGDQAQNNATQTSIDSQRAIDAAQAAQDGN
jgi:hypothetical protein